MFRTILKIIFYLSILFAKPVYGQEQFSQGVAFSVADYPEIQNITYDRAGFMAEPTALVLSNTIEYYLEQSFPRRIYSVADHVYGPPGTLIDVDYIYKNESDTDLDISQIYLMLSRNILENGDLSKMIEEKEDKEGNFSYLSNGLELMRSGKFLEYNGIGNVSSSKAGIYVLDRFEIKNPLKIETIQTQKNSDGKIEVKIYVQNTSDEYLTNLVMTHGTFEKTFELPAQQEKIISFTVDSENDLEKIKIYNPNVKEECSVMGSKYYNATQPDAINVLAKVNGTILPGFPVQPAQESFCIKRIPYTMTSEVIKLNEATEEDSTQGNVLGVSTELKILPETGKVDPLFLFLLVVDGVLWYSFVILRRQYESKNINSRLRSKSSKNGK